MHLLIVEDQPVLQQVLVSHLEGAGFKVSVFSSAEAVFEQGAHLDCQLAVIDINLPGEDGLTLAKKLKNSHADIGIIILTVHHELGVKVKGYESGADLFLTKPIDPQELVASINALKRRLVATYGSYEEVKFDPVKQKLMVATQQISLSYLETHILHNLTRADGLKMEYWQLLEICRLDLDEKGRKQLEVIMSRLRTKLIKVGLAADALKSIRGYGYMLRQAMSIQS